MVTITQEAKETPSLEKAIPVDSPDFTEIVTFCPNCKNLQTLLFSQGELVSKRRYSQHNGAVYHNCGSDKPCRFL